MKDFVKLILCGVAILAYFFFEAIDLIFKK